MCLYGILTLVDSPKLVDWKYHCALCSDQVEALGMDSSTLVTWKYSLFPHYHYHHHYQTLFMICVFNCQPAQLSLRLKTATHAGRCFIPSPVIMKLQHAAPVSYICSFLTKTSPDLDLTSTCERNTLLTTVSSQIMSKKHQDNLIRGFDL